jgi:hypothetical protein
MGKKKRRTSQDVREENLKTKKKFQEKLDKLGLGYQELDIPPDEVNQKDVEKGMWHTLRSMIPYTNEYYEAAAAEDELNDLVKIRREMARATELVQQACVGDYNEALEEMLAETNNDFYYFNKIKYRQEQEGKWKYEPKQQDPFKYLGRGQNRLRKAISKQYAMLDEVILKKLAAHGKGVGHKGDIRQLDKDKPCSWA